MDNINTPDYVSEQDYEYILNSYLGNVRDDVDKREGSIIWDAGAPCCIEIAKAYIYLQAMILNCFASTAVSPFLELRCEEQGVKRHQATYARRLGVFTDGNEQPYAVPIGTDFSTVGETNLVNFKVVEVYTQEGVTIPGSYILECTEPGEIGNVYFGEIVPVLNLTNLATATLSDVLVPGEDIEDIEILRQRYFNRVRERAFGGNITDYREFVNDIDGVGNCQIYPVWNGGGTVKISIIDSTFSPASDTLIATVQREVDPHYNDAYAGKGLGKAPIGHVVTVVGGTGYTVNIEADVVPQTGYTLQQIKPQIITNIEQYFLSLRKEWADSDDTNNYSVNVIRAKVMTAILNTQGVENVTSCLLNNASSDIVLTENSTTQQIPVLGEVTLNG